MVSREEAIEFIKIKNEMKKLKEREAELRDKMIEHFDAEGVEVKDIEGYEIKVKTTSTKTFNGKQFKAEHPDMYESYRVESERTTVTVKRVD